MSAERACARRRVIPRGPASLAGMACIACCVIPALLSAGILAGSAWAGLGRVMPGIAVTVTALAGLTWPGGGRLIVAVTLGAVTALTVHVRPRPSSAVPARFE
jgi:hypothetical protein